jgi:hypothetical protein
VKLRNKRRDHNLEIVQRYWMKFSVVKGHQTTRLTWVLFLKEKSEAFEKFKTYKDLVEIETELKIKILRSDNGGEFTSKEFSQFCENHGIKRQFSSPRTPQQNGVVDVQQHRYSNRGQTPSVNTHITISKINTLMFSHGKTPTGKHPRPQPTCPLGVVY